MLANAESVMRHALALAEPGRGHVEPNPLVGAVLVRDGEVVGEGRHERFGDAHAEVNAIARAGDKAQGATLVVTLEPCCHHGKTPPCTEAIIRAGIKDVVAAIEDPFPQVAGQAAARLGAAGIPIRFGVCEHEARRLNAPYLKLLVTGRPYVHAKWAMSLDGKIASRGGDSKWISNEASRRVVHALRGRMDAIVVGIGTALADDPLLTARPPGPRVACRVVLDAHARLPEASRLVQSARDFPTLVAVGQADEKNANVDVLSKAGCEVLPLPAANNQIDLHALLMEMGKRRWTNILVEGGGQVLGAFRDAGQIDEVHVFIAPRLLGGNEATSAMGGLGAGSIAEGLQLEDVSSVLLEGDTYLHGLKRGRTHSWHPRG